MMGGVKFSHPIGLLDIERSGATCTAAPKGAPWSKEEPARISAFITVVWGFAVMNEKGHDSQKGIVLFGHSMA